MMDVMVPLMWVDDVIWLMWVDGDGECDGNTYVMWVMVTHMWVVMVPLMWVDGDGGCDGTTYVGGW